MENVLTGVCADLSDKNTERMTKIVEFWNIAFAKIGLSLGKLFEIAFWGKFAKLPYKTTVSYLWYSTLQTILNESQWPSG